MISFVYSTFRKDCLIEWFVSSLEREARSCKFRPGAVELIVVDAQLWGEDPGARREEVQRAVRGRFKLIHVAPKPSAYQGPARLTKKGNYFSGANPRNTGLAYASKPYVALIDDLSIMMPGSLRHLLQACAEKRVVTFAYEKVWDLSPDGSSCTHKPEGRDARWPIGKDDAFVSIHGTAMCGYASAPLEALLKVNGYDQVADGIGGEDYHLGYRLQKAGYPIWYHRGIMFYESEDHAVSTGAIRRRSPMTKEDYESKMKLFKIPRRWKEPDPADNDPQYFTDWLVQDTLHSPGHWTLGNAYNLRDIRAGRTHFATSFDPTTTRTLEGTLLTDL
jgi:hypothetical protein